MNQKCILLNAYYKLPVNVLFIICMAALLSQVSKIILEIRGSYVMNRKVLFFLITIIFRGTEWPGGDEPRRCCHANKFTTFKNIQG